MEKIIDIISENMDFFNKIIEKILVFWRLEKYKVYSTYISYFLLISILLIGNLIRSLFTKWRINNEFFKSKLIECSPYIGKDTIDAYRKNYIKPYSSFYSPYIEFDPNLNSSHNLFDSLDKNAFIIDRNKTFNLMDYFTNYVLIKDSSLITYLLKIKHKFIYTSFEIKRQTQKKFQFQFILADTGMGKTAFLINLFYLLIKEGRKTHFISFVDDNIESKISSINDKGDSILIMRIKC